MAKSPGEESRIDLMPIGIAKIDITPENPIRLSVYGNRTEPSEGISQRLHAKALVIGSDHQLSLPVTVDSIGIPAWVSNELSVRLNQKFSIPRAGLVVASSHTHEAPALYGTLSSPVLQQAGSPSYYYRNPGELLLGR